MKFSVLNEGSFRKNINKIQIKRLFAVYNYNFLKKCFTSSVLTWRKGVVRGCRPLPSPTEKLGKLHRNFQLISSHIVIISNKYKTMNMKTKKNLDPLKKFLGTALTRCFVDLEFDFYRCTNKFTINNWSNDFYDDTAIDP